MLKLSALLSLIILLSFSNVSAQSPNILINNDNFSWSGCLGSTYRLPIITTGTFGAGNKFSVQVRKSSAPAVVKEIAAVLNDGFLEFVFSDSLLFANTDLQLKAVSSAPKVESAWSNRLGINSKGTITLNNATISDTLNKFDQVNIKFTGYGAGQINVTLDDSSHFSIYPNGLNFVSEQPLRVSKTEPYKIAHAENVCGAMRVSGSYLAKINSTSVRTISFAPLSVCENGEVNVTISTSGTPLTAQTKYKLRFTEAIFNDKPKVAEVAATLSNNVLTAKAPAQFGVETLNEVYIQVVTDNPATVSSRTSERLFIWASPSAYFNTQSSTINFGEPVQLDVRVKGIPPFTAELTNGATVSSPNSSLQFYSLPLKDESYTLKSMSSGCGKTEIMDIQTVEIKVRPGIRIDEDKTPQILCAGAKGKIKFSSNASLTEATRFSIRMTNGVTGETSILPASRSGDFLEVTLPQNAQGYRSYTYQIITTNPAMESQQSHFITGQTIPDAQFSGYNFKYNYDIPSDAKLSYILTGGAPYSVEYADGSVATYPNDGDIITQEMFLKETTDFKIKSISNTCFKNENVRSARLTVTPSQNPGIYLEPVKRAICNNDSLEIVFGTVGTFNSGNKFTIQGHINYSELQNIITVDNAGKFKIKMTTQSFYEANAGIRIASTNPVLFTEIRPFSVQEKPTNFSVYPPSKPEDPYRILEMDIQRSLTLTSTSPSISKIVYTENGVEKTFNNLDPTPTAVYMPISPKSGELTTYEIKSATNVCGTADVNLKTYVAKMPYRISISIFNSMLKFCAGAPIQMPFGILEGTASDATFSLQMGSEGSSDYQTLVSGVKDRILKGVIPAATPAGPYYVRIVSSDGSISDLLHITITTPPTATLRAQDQSGPILVNAGEPVRLELILTGTSPWETTWTDGRFNLFSSDNLQIVDVRPSRKQEFAISSVSNECGYGTTSGSVAVSVKPKLIVSSSSSSVCEGSKFKVNYELLGEVDMADDYIRFLLVNQSTGAIQTLDSAKTVSGTINLQMPKVLPGSFYELRVTARKYSLFEPVPVYVAILADLTIKGSTTINSGENAQLSLKSNRQNFESVQYILSDGTTGNATGSLGAVSYVRVSPKQTTTYTLTSVTNACGAGQVRGSAVVEVNPTATKTVSVTNWSSLTSAGFCTEDTISVEYKTTGTFSADNKMTVQISDTTGRNWRNIVTTGAGNPLKATLPLDLFPDKQYSLRIVASDGGTASGAYEYPLTAGKKARAKFATESVIYDGKTNPRVKVLLEGGAPWTYHYGTSVQDLYRRTSSPIDEIELYNASVNQFYMLFQVYNSCGTGIINNPATVRIEVITATEPRANYLKVTVSPNPTQDFLQLAFESGEEKRIQLIDLNGRILRTFSTKQLTETMDIQMLSVGIYILNIDSKGKKSTFKVVKR
ncbi:T9SS type A sorting domain-containing protein [Dyadobacter sp. CY327]|uniref:T9SS type A sorting domain-containing protein n=1 Tax=Dyadobacter sp. CY327 TaxID=2907301 RepID=UPI001F299219|nr:T9SS type A sorting domain-containing protein [Dyadobacter sp. CY327]MCE7072175.1 T9SS type A sorting domain-containing protein [Dyadobacter sp. CY327]